MKGFYTRDVLLGHLVVVHVGADVDRAFRRSGVRSHAVLYAARNCRAASLSFLRIHSGWNSDRIHCRTGAEADQAIENQTEAYELSAICTDSVFCFHVTIVNSA